MLALLFAFFLFASADFNCDLNTCSQPSKQCCCVSPCLEKNFTTLNLISPGLWTVLSHFKFMDAYETNNRMFIVKSVDSTGSFLTLINGVHLCPLTLSMLRKLVTDERAPIRYVISPGDWHYLFLSEYRSAFPNAKIYIPPGRIQKKDPVNSPKYTLIDVTSTFPLSFLQPTIVVIPWRGLRQGPADGADADVTRNEFIFYLPKQNAILAGDTLFYRPCGAPPHVSFNPQGKSMVKDKEQFRSTVQRLQSIKYNAAVTLHGELGSILLSNASSLVSDALEAVLRSL